MREMLGVLAAVLSSTLGGTAIVSCRYLAPYVEPVALGSLRFGLGFLLLLPLALLAGGRWPPRRDWPAVLALGLLLFGLFPIFFNAAMAYTTAARGGLAMASVPLVGLAAGALLGVERLTGRKTLAVLIAFAGVATALVTGLDSAPPGAWRGDLLMAGAAACMALYNVLSRPYIARSDPVSFTALGMGAGSLCLALLAAARGEFAVLPGLPLIPWLAIAYLAVFGAVGTFLLWSFALGRTTPTKVSISVTVNPVVATLLGALLLDEPVTWHLVVGLAAVGLGIALAVTARAAPVRP